MAYKLEPEVAGGWGESTVADTSSHPPIIEKFEYQFDGWSGDDLLTSFPCFVVTEHLANDIKTSKLSGFELAPVLVTKSEEFNELYPNTVLPNFEWLKITGAADKDDFAINNELRLVVSEAAFEILSKFNLNECEVEKC